MLSDSYNKKRKYVSQKSQAINSKIVKTSIQTLKTFKPYWNEFTKEISQKLPLHITVATNLNTLNSPSIRLAQNAWF
ncbi:hypothetical protein C2G38_1445314 [Gigaspora rosea]|uniref:Uncharacterized protein n=1 Tax=Gigaspora rosea TaxID=44941 RepID=A0A397VBB4_9GLOM|nr:hypothetical protein C2G38_1445314 [Gigaspora rosea]